MNINTSLERLTQRMIAYRSRQASCGYNQQDDARSPGELLDAAIAYLETARTQLKTRNPYAVEDHGRRMRSLYGNGYRHRPPPGGSDIGSQSARQSEPHERMPSDIPWQGRGPAINMFLAGAFILAELQRIEREEVRVINAKMPKKATKSEREVPDDLNMAGAAASFTGTSISLGPPGSTTVTFPMRTNGPLVFQP